MSCNYPMIGVKGDLMPSGKYKINILGRYDSSLKNKYPDAVKIPCGKCLGCRAAYSKEWADRMILELDHSKKAIFLTLTYNDDHLPVLYQVTTGQSEMTLKKRDLQLFFKRLRKRFSKREIRYYASGEYGKYGRPHYHCIIFGISLSDFEDLTQIGSNELGQIYYKSEFLSREIWRNGYCLLADVSWKSCSYVARYVRKKQFGLVSDEFIYRMQEPVFSVCSRNPGIGMYYPIEHPEYAEYSKYYFTDQNGSIEVSMPKEFLNVLELQNPMLYEEIKQSRKQFANDAEFMRMKNTDLTSMEQYEISENQISKTAKYLESLQKF